MTNQERRDARYLRRKQKRIDKKENFLNSMPSYEEVFSYENLWNAFWLCRKEVSWKPSIQFFQQNLAVEITKLRQELLSKQGFKSRGFITFKICERGKMRLIKSVDIRERVVQRCFCDNYIVPILTKGIVYDNGASLKNKGVAFALKRLRKHLNDFYRKYHTNEGYILLYDFSNYFGSISHKKLYEIVDPLIKDSRCLKLYHYLIDAFGEESLGLGSQVSQVSAVCFPDSLDKAFANTTKAEDSARYMDDGYVIFKDKEDADIFINTLSKITNILGITLNAKKIILTKISKTFIFLKKRFYLANNGKVVMKLNRNNIFKHKRKIMKLLGLVNKGKLLLEDVWNSHKSWYGQIRKKFDNRRSLYNVHNEIGRILNEYQNRIITVDCCGI